MSDEPKEPAPLLEFKPREVSVEARIDRSKPLCFHDATYIDKMHRTLECRVCGAQVDPYDFIDKLAHRMVWSRHLQNSYDLLDKRLARVLESGGRVHLTASGASCRVITKDGQFDANGTGKPLESVCRAVDNALQKSRIWDGWNGPKAVDGS